jgi:hypothetical protein
MRRLTGDSGAVAVIVGLLAVVLFGFGALVIDVGALYAERSELQSGADAAALAVAQDCAAGACGSATTTSEEYADANASDDVSGIDEVCGNGPGLSSCPTPRPSPPGSGYVRVTTRTESTDGGHLVPPALARAIVPGYQGSEVHAASTVAWGAAGGVDAELALTFSQCEYERLTGVSTGEPVYAPPFTSSLERIVYFHDTTEAGSCPAGPSGADLPGGFGWLDADDSCSATVVDGWVDDKTGSAASNDCKAALTALLGKTLLIPVFDATNGLTGTNGEYRIWSYVGFVLTGWRFPGSSQSSSYLGGVPCSSSQTCISGFFTEAVTSGGSISDGPDQGVRVVQLVS